MHFSPQKHKHFRRQSSDSKTTKLWFWKTWKTVARNHTCVRWYRFGSFLSILAPNGSGFLKTIRDYADIQYKKIRSTLPSLKKTDASQFIGSDRFQKKTEKLMAISSIAAIEKLLTMTEMLCSRESRQCSRVSVLSVNKR